MSMPQSQVQSARMPRQRRLHLPKAGFHITARTQSGTPYFTTDIRTSIAGDIEEAVPSFGHALLAYVVMPNHFHLVLKQGDSPLGWVMQRIMQRAVVQVRRAFGGEGHVFGRPYWAGVCADPVYLRRAIIYTHLNPVKARMCEAAGAYEWSSHNAYTAAAGCTSPNAAALHEGKLLFADQSQAEPELRHSYTRFIDYCMFQRANHVPGDWLLPDDWNRMRLPSAAFGDAHWASNYAGLNEPNTFTPMNVDVARPALLLLSRIDRDVTLDMIRAAGRSRTLSKIRRQLIEGLLTYGCRTTAIGRCLRISPTLVSRIRQGMRVSAVRPM
jgi:REP element-mobilizing transposase RayT